MLRHGPFLKVICCGVAAVSTPLMAFTTYKTVRITKAYTNTLWITSLTVWTTAVLTTCLLSRTKAETPAETVQLYSGSFENRRSIVVQKDDDTHYAFHESLAVPHRRQEPLVAPATTT